MTQSGLTPGGEVLIPSVGVAMTEATLTRWLKQPGDWVETGDVVAEIESDKATIELTAPRAGRLGRHLVEAGETVPVAHVVVRILGKDERDEGTNDISAPASREQGGSLSTSPGQGASLDVGDLAESGARAPHRQSPRAKSLARRRQELGSDGGQLGPQPDFRSLIAAKVSESWHSVPHFSVTRTMDAEVLVAALRRLRDSVDPALTISDLLLRALASGVRNLIEPDSVDLGLAVATPGGVVVPVITRVLDRELHSLGEARRKAVARAREGRLNEEDLTRVPWATLSNLGSLGVDHFTGIIPLGQMSLLTVGRIAYRVVSDESREVTVKAAFDATLNADHRKLDGADVAHLLSSIAAAVNDPMILEGKAPFT